ncbi:hypothetical protein MSAN_00940200 [Mycena sanguinolenta]|uniref:Uncharacterized protein n=1 Tax=Mycena sanguinolenta TaxID=230812 RepID=A0A8H7D941_9AGAR|nr:hypothetical protein MSAN_00940200 [Mycena sanguinolenta]
MCLNDNSAPLSVRYINSQLSAMWENAAECVRHGGKQTKVDLRSGEYLKHQYTRSLAEFHFAGFPAPKGEIAVDDLFFYGSFGKPSLEFICNHEAVLRLTLLPNFHFDKVYPTKKTVRGYKSNKKDRVLFKQGLEVAFRLKFSRRNLSGKDSRIGNGANVIQMLILDFSSAQMILFKPFGAPDALEWYLKQYLTFLQNAGHHVRYDLPDFDNDNYSLNINYSLVTRALDTEELCAGVTVHGISEPRINEFLRDTWLDVVSKAKGLLWPAADGQALDIRFGPPRVRALCNHEVVLYFKGSKIHFYDSPDFNREPINSYVDWKFAFIVDVVEDKSTPVHSLKLDLSTARFCPHLSTTFTEVSIHFTELITFFRLYYLDLLVQYNMLCIYYPGGYLGEEEAPGFTDISEDESEWHLEEVTNKPKGIIVWTETVKQIKLYGFDHMIAVSEVSINTLFVSLRKAAPEGLLTRWSHKKAFDATFDNIRVKLLSGSKALVTFTVDHGHLTLDDKESKYKFNSWTIAFEVAIKMVDQAQPKKPLLILKGNETCSTTKHIILDLDTAEYAYKHSSMPSMWHDGDWLAIEQLKSLIHFMRKYFVRLSAAGLNIIHSIPIFPVHQHFGLTSASFQIVSKDVVTITNCMFEREAPRSHGGRNDGRPPPPCSDDLLGPRLGYSRQGPPRTAQFVSPARRSLRESCSPPLRSSTDAPPLFPDSPASTRKSGRFTSPLGITTAIARTSCATGRRFRNSNRSWLEYAWEHRDEWSYEHDSTRNKAFAFSVLCHTKNQLCIPTTYHPRSMEIILRGESVLRVKRKHDEEHSNWSKRSSAKWSVKINVKSEVSGLRVTIAEQVHPVFDATESEGKWDIDTHKLLEQHLPRIVDIREVVQELKQVFEGAWQYSCAGSKAYSLVSPVFTQNGDLIMQLGTFTETSTTATVTSTPARPLIGSANSTVANGTAVPTKIGTPAVTLTEEIFGSKEKMVPSKEVALEVAAK